MNALFVRLFCLLSALFLATTALAFNASAEIRIAQLPPEAQHTLRLIEAGGPYPYRRDGIVFNNYEQRLPLQPRGYYREYTVPTPGLNHRGARRIITGAQNERYYTANHYRSFLMIRP